MKKIPRSKRLILFFNELGIEDVPLVGGKNASLGEMYRNLTKKGVRVPNGFAVTANAYRFLLKDAKVEDRIKKALKGLNVKKIHNLQEKGKAVRDIIRSAKFPEVLERQIINAYRKLCKEYGHNTDVAVRSSATAEDLPSIAEDSHVLIKADGNPAYDSIKNVYERFGDGSNNMIEVAAMKNNEVEWSKANIYKHPAKNKKVYKIITQTGREIKITENHSLIVLDQNNLEPKTISISELKGNEMVPVTRSIPAMNLNIDEIDVLDYIDNAHLENELVYIKNRSNNWKIQNPLKRKIFIDEDFAYFLGLYCAEGSTYKNNGIIITNSDKKVIGRVKKFLKDISLYQNQKINKNSLRVYCKALVKLLHSLTGTPLDMKGKGRSCKIKKVPDFIFGCRKEIIAEFLKACFDGDGYVSKKSIEYTSTSEKLIGGIVKLLEILNIDFYIRRKKNAFTIIIPASNAVRFRDMIGLEHPKKIERLDMLIESYDKKQNHPSFINNISVSDNLSKVLKSKFDDNLEKQSVDIAICPECNKNIEKTSYYNNKLRYYCRDCKKAFYEERVKKKNIRRYVYYDEKGKFRKFSTPWNKGLISGNFSKKRFAKLMKKYGLDKYSELFDKSVMWDRIKEVKEFDYNGFVYDFSVPKLENFAAGIGGIITHNSASFAGQQETYLNVRGEHELIESCRKCFASLFTNRAISYREEKGFEHFKVALSIGVQKMVRSDLSCSGVMFSIDTETGFKEVVFITGAYGLGENVVQGAVNPDEYYVHKPTLKKGYKPIITKSLGAKKIRMIYDEQGSKNTTKNVIVPDSERKKFVVNDKDILKLAEWAVIIEEHYSKKAGKFKPMDMEWAKDGKTGKLFIVQARPETVQSQKNLNFIEEFSLRRRGSVLVEGHSVGQKIGKGKAHVIKDVKDIKKFRKGEVLVTDMTDPDWEPIMKIAAAIVTNRGGRTCHAAIISRELGIPCVVGTTEGTEKIKKKEKITVSCAEGDVGYIYKGLLKYKVNKINLKKIPKTKTHIMMNVGTPEQAFELSFLPNDGVGLAREEFIINSYIKIHPKALIEFKSLRDSKLIEKIEKLTFGYHDKEEFFVDKLSQGIARIAAAFYPKPVILRFSDFKSNEYANLIGGKMFEPTEDNPMIGWRGASRYYKGEYKEAFGLECEAIKRVRDVMGLTNVIVMIPFCRTVEEARKVLDEMYRNGLEKGHNGLKVYGMCEIPSNVLLAEEFLKVFDGFSIGSNDLTQLTLGLDRDSELVSDIYDERNEAVKKLVREVIKVANRKKKYIGICGQAPSDYPEFAQFLVKAGIKSISLNPDTVVRTRLKIAQMEKRMRR